MDTLTLLSLMLEFRIVIMSSRYSKKSEVQLFYSAPES